MKTIAGDQAILSTGEDYKKSARRLSLSKINKQTKKKRVKLNGTKLMYTKCMYKREQYKSIRIDVFCSNCAKTWRYIQIRDYVNQSILKRTMNNSI